MKNTVYARDFLTAITKVNKVLPKKTNMPILQQIKVEFTDNKCTLIGTNLEQIIITSIDAQGDDFSFVFNDTKAILKACKYFENDLIFTFDDGKITLNSNKKSCKQFTFIEEEFPNIPKVKADDSYIIQSDALLNRYNKVKYAVSTNEKQPVLTGICFRNDKIITSDGFRMAMNTDVSLTVNREIVVPQEAMNLLSIFDKNININMLVNHKYLSFSNDNTIIISRLIEGNFPKTDSIIPQNSNEEYNIGTKEFENQLKYLNEFTDKQNNIIKFKNGILSTHNNGEYTSQVDFGQESDIIYGFKCNYMLDAIGQFKNADIINYKIISKVAPIVITDGSDLALVLPWRLKDIA